MTNYFDFFGLPAAPTIDEALLKRTFYANSRKFHPDFHTLSDDNIQEEALERSTINNQGYKILSDPEARLKHFLEVNQVLGEEGSNNVPQDFLMEVMEVNEALMELEMEADPMVRQKVTGLIEQLEADLGRDASASLDKTDPTDLGEADLAILKDYYLKKRYLLRLKEKM